MRSLPAAPHHVVIIRRAMHDAPPVDIPVPMKPLPLGFGSALEAVFPPPVVYVNGKAEPDTHRMPEYQELKAMVLLAQSLTGDFTPEANPPAAAAKREAWDAYARAVRDEIAAAGFVSGDIVALMEGFAVVNEGRGLGKSRRSSGPGE